MASNNNDDEDDSGRTLAVPDLPEGHRERPQRVRQLPLDQLQLPDRGGAGRRRPLTAVVLVG